MSTTLVIGGTGMVGSHVTTGLLGRGESVRVLTRSAGKPSAGGATVVAGSLEAPESLPAAMNGVDRVFLLTPLSPTETEQGLAGIAAAKAGGVKRIVYLSVHKVREAPGIPHFASKVPIENAIAASGMEYSILAPNNFYQNDLWLRDAILQYGVYPQPFGNRGLNRVDVRDIADAAVNCLLESGHNGETYPLIGPEAWTGESTAATYAKHLGRPVTYAGDVQQWAQQAKSMMPDWLVEDLVIMYEWFQKNGLAAEAGEFEQQAKALKHAPRPFEDFVAETVASWK